MADEANDDHADDATWVLTSAFIILTMQSGFGLLEMGSSSPGFEVNIMTKNVMDVVFGALTYWFVGYGLSYGEPSNPFMGMGATATTIVSGAVSMRMRFLIYCAYATYAIVFYSFVAHWIWADNGWLRTMGVHDFAGGGPVHLLGGTSALIAVIFVGPRTGYFQQGNNRTKFAASSPASTLFGLFMLWWGWIGFNCGSTSGITGTRWIVASRAAMTTVNASAAGGAVSLLYTLRKTGWKQVRVHHLVHGILGALVSTSPTCAVIHSWQALITGAIGAVLANISNTLLKRVKIDDPVGAIGVHAGGAIWGYIAVGLFADSTLPGVNVMDGLFAGGGGKLLGLQLLAIVSIMAWSLVTVTPFFYLVGIVSSKDWKDPRSGLRLIKEHELIGEDKRLHGVDLPFDSSIRFGTSGATDIQSVQSVRGAVPPTAMLWAGRVATHDTEAHDSKPNQKGDDNNNEENPGPLNNIPISVSTKDALIVSCLNDQQFDSFDTEQYSQGEEGVATEPTDNRTPNYPSRRSAWKQKISSMSSSMSQEQRDRDHGTISSLSTANIER
ncbi:hypothetical protein ACHAXT_005077 [Thalassiosira profunda]